MLSKVSASDLNAWAWYRNSEQSDEDFLKRLRYEQPPNEKMEAGRAFHKYLELRAGSPVDGYTFTGKIELPVYTVREYWVERPMRFEGGRVIWLRGIVDGIRGRQACDYKTTGRLDLEKYAMAWQWRVYMYCLPHVRQFIYHVFRWHKDRRDDKMWHIAEQCDLKMYRYADLECDLRQAVSGFLLDADRLGFTGRPPRKKE